VTLWVHARLRSNGLSRSWALTAAGQFANSHKALLDALEIVPDDAYATPARLTRAYAAVFRKIAVSSRVELARAVEHADRARSSHAS
jgi:hypothetical protein